MHRVQMVASSPIGLARPLTCSRPCVVCHLSSHGGSMGITTFSEDIQYVNSCSSALEELHRVHRVSCCAVSRSQKMMVCKRKAATFANMVGPRSQQAEHPTRLQCAAYSPARGDMSAPRQLVAAAAVVAGGLRNVSTNAAGYANDPRIPSGSAIGSTSASTVAQPPTQHPVVDCPATTAEGIPPSNDSPSSSNNISSNISRQQHQRQLPMSTQALHRPTAISHKAMRQLLQQQIESATCWQQLHQLLVGRRQSLTLKHLSLIVFQVAQLQVEANKQRLRQLHSQHQQYHQHMPPNISPVSSANMYNSNNVVAGTWQHGSPYSRGSSRMAAPPQDVLSEQAQAAQQSASSAEGLEPFLQQLAAAVQAAVLADPGLAAMMKPAAADTTTASAAAAPSLQTPPLSNGAQPEATGESDEAATSTGSKSSSGSGFSNPPDRMSTYLANILWGYAKLRHSPAEDQLLLWLEAFAAVCYAADAVSFSQVCWSLGQLQFWPGDEVMEQLAAELARRLEASTAAIAEQSESADQSKQYQQQHLQAGSVEAADTAEESCSRHISVQQYISCRALSNILWAFAVLGYSPSGRVLQTIWSGSLEALGTASPQTLSNMIWAVATLGLKPTAEWMANWQSAVSEGLQEQQWGSADLANAAWAVGKFASSQELRSLVPDLPWRLSLMRTSRGVLTTADPRELVALSWGFTAAGVAFTATFTDRLLAAVATKRVHFKAREWAQLLVVIAKQGLTPHPVWQRGCHAAISTRLRFMSALDFSTCLWGIARLGVEPRRAWKERFFAESYSQLFFLTPSNCCALIWALGRLQWRPPLEWQDRLFLETYIKVASFSAAELTGTLHGLAALQLQPPVQWMCQATAALALAVPDLGPQEITTCLWALSRLRYRPPEPWLASLAAQAAQLLPEAWKTPMQQHQQQQIHTTNSIFDQSVINSTWAGVDASCSAAAAHLLRVQQVQDRREAAVRHRRQQLMQQLKQVDEQQQQQQQQQLARFTLQQGLGMHRLKHAMSGQETELQQLQLRGDLELLQQQRFAARKGGLSKQQLQQGDGHAADMQDSAVGVDSLQETGPGNADHAAGDWDDDVQQHQQEQAARAPNRTRLLGRHDVKIALEAFEQLQYKADSDHPLLVTAKHLGLLKSDGSVRRSTFSSNDSSLHSAGAGSSLGTDDIQQTMSGRSLAVDDPSMYGVDETVSKPSVVNMEQQRRSAAAVEEDEDVFTPRVHGTSGSEQVLADSRSATGGWSIHDSKQLHVLPTETLRRRNRHGRRFSSTGQT